MAEKSAGQTGKGGRTPVGGPPSGRGDSAGSGGRLKAWGVWFAIGAAGAALAAGFWLHFAGELSRSSAVRLPGLPDLSGRPVALVAHLREADRAARMHPASADAVGALGMAYHADVFYDHAARCYALAAELDARDWRWVYYAALLQQELGASDVAAVALRRTVALNPDFAPAWLRLGEAALKQGMYDEAERAYKRAVSADGKYRQERAAVPELRGETFPISADASYGLARLAMRRGQLDDAARMLERLTAAYAEFGPAHRLLGQVYEKLGRREEAGERIARASIYAPHHPPADPMVDALARESRSATFLLKQMGVATQSGNGPWAEYLGRRAVAFDSEDAQAAAGLGLLLLRLNRPDEALPYLRRYREMVRDDAGTLMSMGYGLSITGKFPEAVEYVREALRIAPENVEAHTTMGLVLGEMGKLDEAAGHFRDALRINPDYAEAHKDLADLLSEQGKSDEAVHHCREALRIRPDYAEAYNTLGKALIQKGELAEARRYLEKAARIRPDYAQAYNNLGKVLARQGASAEARRHLEKALRIRPDYDRAHNNLGVLLAQKGDLAGARRHLEEALRIRPDYAEAHNNLGKLLAQKGDLAGARRHLERALKIEPGYAGAHNNFAVLLARTGDLAGARRHLEEALRLRPDYVEARSNLDRLLAGVRPK